MKRAERDEARKLRKEGKSLNEIVKLLNVSKASVSMWVRDVQLSDAQRQTLNANGFSVDAIEKRRINRIQNTLNRHREVINKAKRRITSLSPNELFLVGVALYWGEGSKRSKGQVAVANADPFVIKIMMRFFREVCRVEESKFRAHVHTFSHLNAKKAEDYWSEVAKIPLTQFYKTYSKPSKAGLGKRDSLPYGTVQIYVCDTNLLLQVMGYIERLAELA